MTHKYEINEERLVDFDEIGVPSLELDVFVSTVGVFVSGVGFGGCFDVFLAVLDNLGEGCTVDVCKRDSAIGAVVLDHVLDRLTLERNGFIDLERFAFGALEDDLLRHSWQNILKGREGDEMMNEYKRWWIGALFIGPDC